MRPKTPRLRASPKEDASNLAQRRDWFYASIREVNDQLAAIARAKEVPPGYITRWVRITKVA